MGLVLGPQLPPLDVKSVIIMIHSQMAWLPYLKLIHMSLTLLLIRDLQRMGHYAANFDGSPSGVALTINLMCHT